MKPIEFRGKETMGYNKPNPDTYKLGHKNNKINSDTLSQTVKIPSTDEIIKGMDEWADKMRGRHDKYYLRDDFFEGVMWMINYVKYQNKS